MLFEMHKASGGKRVKIAQKTTTKKRIFNFLLVCSCLFMA